MVAEVGILVVEQPVKPLSSAQHQQVEYISFVQLATFANAVASAWLQSAG